MTGADAACPIETRSRALHGLLRLAGEQAATHFRHLDALQVESKQDAQDLVSNADREVEALLRTRLGAAFPDDGFLGEEFGVQAGASGFVWVIDPVDGTSAFLQGLRSWCISVALMWRDEVVAGVILDVCADELFHARAGQGAWLGDQRIAVDRKASLQSALMGLGANLRVPARAVSRFVERLLTGGGMFYRNGSGALMLAYVACGRLIAYYEPHINAWDCLAGLLLVREAGGWTADFPSTGSGDLLAGGPVVAAAPQVREALLALIQESVRN